MSELTLFNNEEFGTIRTLTIEENPWFVGKDVAGALGYSNGRDALSKHVDEEDKGVAKCDTHGGTQEMTIINESGLYSLILSSKLESAKRFKRWVTSEVLPAIRKTGSYNTGGEYDRMELARIISSCKSTTAVKTISALFGIGIKPINDIPRQDNDGVRRFLEIYDTSLLQVIPTHAIYKDYVNYCHTIEYNPFSLSAFSKKIHKLTGLIVKRRRINGTLTGFFTSE